MKKAFLPLSLAALLALPSVAQESRGFKLGIKAAPNLGWIKSTSKELEGDGVNLGFSFGLMGDFRLGSDNYALSTGLFMNLLGANQTSKAYKTAIAGSERDVPAFEFARRYQYVELPILIKLKTNEMGYMTYFGQLGFGSAFCVSAKSDVYTYNDGNTSGTNAQFDREEKANILKETVPFRASLVVGIGAEYKFAGNTTLVFGINYNNGFTDTFDKDELFKDSGFEVADRVEAHGKLHYAELLLGVYF